MTALPQPLSFPSRQTSAPGWYVAAMAQLIDVLQHLSQARSVDAVTAIVRDAARNLTGADGASFVLRDGDKCFYADENAIAPLWKGKRFPLSTCVSGWVMLNAQSTVIEDIYADPRVPTEAYRPTFVKSMAMVPIRRQSPIGAIGNYWATKRKPTEEEVAILQALADTTSVALENADLYTQLQKKVTALEESNHELGRFAWVASHDLQEPLRMVSTNVEMLEMHCGSMLDEEARHFIRTASSGAQRLRRLIETLLVHARAGKLENPQPVDMQKLYEQLAGEMKDQLEKTRGSLTACSLPAVEGDKELLTRLLHIALDNAIKFHRPGVAPEIQVTCQRIEKEFLFGVKDNGIGVEEKYLPQVFEPFRRLNSPELYPGTGLSLSIAKKIVTLHGGRIWMKSRPSQGSTLFFTLPVTSP